MPPSEQPNEPTPQPRPHAAHRWLLLLPFVWQVAAVPWANAVRTPVFSMPFLMVWEMAGVLFGSAIIALVFRLDRRQANLP